MSDKTAQDYARYRLEKSADELDTAQVMLTAQKYNAAVNRAYYAIFHAIRSILALDVVDFKKHSGVLSYFNKEYLASNLIDRKYSVIIKKASVLRNSGDYSDFFEVSCEEAEDIVMNAAEFIDAVRAYLAQRIDSE